MIAPIDTSTLGPIRIEAHPVYEVGRWYPGASAPRDGTRFVGQWSFPSHPPMVAWWSDQRGGRYPQGWRVSVSSSSAIRLSNDPAAWMPLPAALTRRELEALNGS